MYIKSNHHQQDEYSSLQSVQVSVSRPNILSDHVDTVRHLREREEGVTMCV